MFDRYMYIFGYLRASTKEQDARRAQAFIEGLGHRVAGWYKMHQALLCNALS